MARLGDVPAGFVFAAPESKKERAPRKAEESLACQYCGAEVTRLSPLEKSIRAEGIDDGEDGFTCRCCAQIIGFAAMDGYTDVQRFSAIADAGQKGWAIMLRVPLMCAPDGREIALDMGDIIKVMRAGAIKEGGSPTSKRSKDAWTIDVKLGPVAVTLWPHEFGAMDFATVLLMRGAGDLYERFVGPDDDIGYFAPSDEMRAEINACFGSR